VPFAQLVVAFTALIVWLYLVVARGMFWRVRGFDDDLARREPITNWPTVIAIVPARNEAATIAQSLTSLLQQDYPGQFSVIVVDDHSEDATARRAQQAAADLGAESRTQILTAPPLLPGWTGKLWALNEGISHATGRGAAPLRPSSATLPISASPDFFWFTDADITHAPDTLLRLVSRAARGHLDMTSLMVLLQAKTLPERALIPAFLFFFLKLYPPKWIADPKAKTAGAAGGCILLRSAALHRIGGLAAIRSEVIDDCALARAVKRTGGKIWMGLTRRSLSLRAYNSFAEIRDMITRTAFTQLHYSPVLLLAVIAAMLLIYIAPVALLFTRNPATQILAACAWALMSLLYLPTLRFYSLSPLWAPFLPAIAAFYSYATLLSAIRYYLGRGAHWKGRSQAHS